MKSFDPMNSGDDIREFESQLRRLELRRPPAEWKSLLLPKPPVPWFPKPFIIGLTTCWAATAGLLLTIPPNEILSPPLILPSSPPSETEYLLGFNSLENFDR
jgi:hypothetical protein